MLEKYKMDEKELEKQVRNIGKWYLIALSIYQFSLCIISILVGYVLKVSTVGIFTIDNILQIAAVIGYLIMTAIFLLEVVKIAEESKSKNG